VSDEADDITQVAKDGLESGMWLESYVYTIILAASIKNIDYFQHASLHSPLKRYTGYAQKVC